MKIQICWTAELLSEDVSQLQNKDRKYYSIFVPTAPFYLTVASPELDGFTWSYTNILTHCTLILWPLQLYEDCSFS